MIAKILQAEMKRRKVSLNQLAKDCGIPVSVLHGWVNGILPSAKNLYLVRKLSICLDLSVEELLFGLSDKEVARNILFSTTFIDDGTKYRLTVEKLT